jgi:hypothetical protein
MENPHFVLPTNDVYDAFFVAVLKATTDATTIDHFVYGSYVPDDDDSFSNVCVFLGVVHSDTARPAWSAVLFDPTTRSVSLGAKSAFRKLDAAAAPTKRYRLVCDSGVPRARSRAL